MLHDWILNEKVRLGILLLGMFALCGVEFLVPLRKANRRHTIPNILLMASLILLNLVFSSLTVYLALWSESQSLGVFRWIPANITLQIIFSLLFLDFWAAYVNHYLFHKIKWLWKFHSVHHSDTMVDVTTAFRQHPIESILRICFYISGMMLLGIPIWILFLYLALSGINAQLEHANIKIPTILDKVLQLFYVTPNMHKVHHSKFQKETDSNYGNIFSIWDRIFGTYHKRNRYDNVQYGLDYLKRDEKHSFLKLIILPFKRSKRLT